MRPSTVAVIVGAGHAGGRAAETLRTVGWNGAIVLIGNENHLPYERPPLSKDVLTGRSSIATADVVPPSFYQDAHIDVRLRISVTEIDTRNGRLHLSDGGTLPYDRLLLTTGARPRMLNLPGAALDRVRYLRTRDDAAAIRSYIKAGSRIVVVGGGLIGLELAASAQQCGCKVSVLESTGSLMGRVAPPEIGDFFWRLHNEKGVDIRLETTACRFEEQHEGITTVCSDGERLDADVVVIGIGTIPEAELAAAAGVRCGDGIFVNEFCETSISGIFAAGDVARRFDTNQGIDERLETWQNAQDQAVAAARVVGGLHEPYVPIRYIWTDQYDSRMQIAGRTDGADTISIRGSMDRGTFLVFYFSGSMLTGVVGVNTTRDFALARRLIGYSSLDFDPEALSCEDVSLKRLVSARTG